MIKTIKKFLAAVSVFGLLAVPAFVPAVASAQNIEGNLCSGANLSFNESAGDCSAGGEATSRVNGIVTTIINIFSVVVGIIAVIMIIIGGLKYITSGGDSGNVTGAKNTILYAIIGLVIVALAQIIVRFVLAKVSAQ
ncbi:MAG: rane protein [Candidatus Saccharibacteria bacterium]|nr:rane protein [Candidatus Saccharibacteria bacterium]